MNPDHPSEPAQSTTPRQPEVSTDTFLPNQVENSIQEHYCTQCGYSLRGLDWREACPECGVPVLLSLPGPVRYVRPPEQPAPVCGPLPCVRCGADLTGIMTDSTCAGCQAPAWYSIYGDWLRACDPRWLDRLRWGVDTWIVSLASFALVVLVSGTGGSMWSLRNESRSDVSVWLATPDEMPLALSLSRLLLLLAVSTLSVLAIYRVTTREPRFSRNSYQRDWKRLLRGLAVAYLLMQSFASVMGMVEWSGPARLLDAVYAVLGSVLTTGFMLYLGELIQRVPDRNLTRNLRLVGMGFCTCMLFLYGWGFFGPWLVDSVKPMRTSTMPLELSFGLCVLVVMLTACYISMWMLLFIVRGALITAYQQVHADTSEGAARGLADI